MPKILTKRKRAWVKQRKPDVLRGDVITPPAVVAAKYYRTLHALITEMAEEVMGDIESLYGTEAFAEDATTSSQARILTNYLLRKFTSKFGRKAKVTAERFANQADTASSAAVHSSIGKLSGGLSLPTSAITPEMKDILNATITSNVGLIKSIGNEYLSNVQQAVMRSITTGNGLKDLIPELQKYKDISLRKAELMALDQNRKASNNLAAARFKNLGLEEYEWKHRGGSEHPRKLHEDYDGQIFRYDTPPIIDERTGERGIPGQAIYCRCGQVPVIKFNKG